MKKLFAVLLLASVSCWAQTVSISSTNSTVTAIPDGNPLGTTEQINVSGVGGSVTNVQVQLDITGGFNGDLYIYLVNPAGQMAVLVNRPGVTTGNPYGYSDAGFNITLDGQAANNLHYYGATAGYSLNGTTWAADGRSIDPQSAGSVFASTSPTAGLNIFSGLNGVDMNGTWTLFIADLAAGGGSPQLNAVVLTIMTVPEPQTLAVSLLGGGMLVLLTFKRKQR